MKLASLKPSNNKSDRDGTLIVVDKNLQLAVKVPEIAQSLMIALEDWQTKKPLLEKTYHELCSGEKQIIQNSFPVDFNTLSSPLPRCPQWLDGSAYLSHVRRVRKARGADMPESFLSDPLMYQGACDSFLAPFEDIPLLNNDWGLDLEAEIAIVTDDVAMATPVEQSEQHIKLLMLVNDVSLRNLIPSELAKGFGFIHGKPSGSFSPIAITPDELSDSWSNGKCHLPLLTFLNDTLLGKANAGSDMQFSFNDLISHASKTRKLSAGTIIGSGTVSNNDEKNGVSCLVEKRILEIIRMGNAITPYLTHGDKVHIEMNDSNGNSIFGPIIQNVTQI